MEFQGQEPNLSDVISLEIQHSDNDEDPHHGDLCKYMTNDKDT